MTYIKNKIKKRISDAISNYDFEDAISDAIDNIDIEGIIQNKLDDKVRNIGIDSLVADLVNEYIENEIDELDVENELLDALQEQFNNI